MKLKDRVAIVTGSGRGIGRAIALAMAEQGADVVVAARTLAELEGTAAEIESLGRRALIVQADVSREQEVKAMVHDALGEFGRIDILVNNAGIQGPIGPLAQVDAEEWLRCIRINLGGVFLCCQAVLPIMIDQGAGKIINLSGGGATSPRPFFSAYAASKTAIVRLTETLAEEVKQHNIQVNAIAPGVVTTRMTEQVLAAGSAAGEETLARTRRQKETGGVTPEAAAALAVFLASDESDGLTGRLISAVWDDWRSLASCPEAVMATDLYTLRRITRDTGGG